MTIFKLVEIDLTAERKRIAEVKFTKRQRDALLKLCDLFERGEWQACLDHVKNKKMFRMATGAGYHEVEHIGIEISYVLQELSRSNFYTVDQITAALSAPGTIEGT